jgi:adenosine deaminase
VALGRLQGYSLAKVMDWVILSAKESGQKYHMQVRLIASVNRHEPVELAEEVAYLAAERANQGIVGLDLAGNEAQFPAGPFAGVFREARESGLRITVHAGEWGPAANIREAIEVLGAERIGHGVRIIEDAYVMKLARERGTTLEVCPTSNYQSGVVKEILRHPLARMIESGLKVTINTDDPSISGIFLSDEYRLAVEDLGLPLDGLAECIIQSVRSSFLPKQDAISLEQFMKERLLILIGSPLH